MQYSYSPYLKVQTMTTTDQSVIFHSYPKWLKNAPINNHCDTYDLLPEYQSAYRKTFSCETSLLKLSNDTLWGMENKNITAVIILDLLAAFDAVSDNLLLEILDKKFGIKNKALCWYEQYLRPRRFRVCLNGNYSQEKTMEFSVPQGST